MMRASGTETAIKDDVMAINDQDIAEMTKQLLVDARLGQGKFCTELLTLLGGRCAVTGSDHKRGAVLRTYCRGHSRTIKSG
jgi:hypothetical protein